MALRLSDAIYALALPGLLFAQGADPANVAALGANPSVVKIARFHSLLVFSGFDDKVLEGNEAALRSVLTAFDRDFHDLFKQTPEDAHIIPTRVRLQDKYVPWKGVDTALTALAAQIEPDDVALIYMMAHGATDPQGASALQFGNDIVARSTIVQRLIDMKAARGARLIVFITDNCGDPIAAGQINRQPRATSSIWRTLYFGHHEFLDLSSTDGGEGQRAFVVNGVSIFNEAFSRALSVLSDERSKRLFEDRQQLSARNLYAQLSDRDRNGVVSWQDFKIVLQEQVDAVYEEAKDSLAGDASEAAEDLRTQGRQSISIPTFPQVGQ